MACLNLYPGVGVSSPNGAAQICPCFFTGASPSMPWLSKSGLHSLGVGGWMQLNGRIHTPTPLPGLPCLLEWLYPNLCEQKTLLCAQGAWEFSLISSILQQPSSLFATLFHIDPLILSRRFLRTEIGRSFQLGASMHITTRIQPSVFRYMKNCKTNGDIRFVNAFLAGSLF